ncbi:MAG: 16S rRNA (uracil(1498)-N(3))-methyltransferase [Burkholderiaceae bacterium]
MRPRVLIAAAGQAAAGPAPGNAPLRLDARQSHHLVRVLRLGPGATVECFDGRGARFSARIETADAKACMLRLEERLASVTESPLRITLAQCISSAERMDWTIEKAVELGVHAIQPLSSLRSQVRLDAARAAKRAEHWSRIIEAACMQCGRDRLPLLRPVMTLPSWLDRDAAAGIDANEERANDGNANDEKANDGDVSDEAAPPTSPLPPAPPLGLVLHPAAAVPLSAVAVDRQRPLRLLVGPESGLADDELAAARAAGFMPVKLGPRVLRTETAGLAALAALQIRAGDF